jgi:hypothetical protein
MKYNFLSKMLLLTGVVVFGYSCEKVDVPEKLGDKGQTIVKMPAAPEALAFIELKPTTQTIEIVEIRRDVASQSELSKTMTVTLKNDFSVVEEISGPDIVEMPASAFTFDPANPASGGNVTLTFAPGEFAKSVKIVVPDASGLDPNNQYGIGLVVTSVDQGGKISAELDSVAVLITVKNKYDGVYTATGSAFRADPSSNLQGDYGPVERILATTGPSTVQWTGSVPWATASGSALPAGYEPTITVNEATNKLSLSSPGNFITMDPTYDNRYDPDTRTFYFRFYWGAGPAARLHTDMLVYKRPR